MDLNLEDLGIQLGTGCLGRPGEGFGWEFAGASEFVGLTRSIYAQEMQRKVQESVMERLMGTAPSGAQGQDAPSQAMEQPTVGYPGTSAASQATLDPFGGQQPPFGYPGTSLPGYKRLRTGYWLRTGPRQRKPGQ